MTAAERANQRRWRDDQRGVYEVWYLTWNDPATEHGFWLRYVIEQPVAGHGEPRGELWFARFDPRQPARTFGIHKHVPFATVAAGEAPFVLSIGGCRLSHGSAEGSLAGDGHDVQWQLRWEPAAEPLRVYPDLMYLREGIAPTTPLMPNWHVPLTGTLVVDGETHRFDRVAMGQTHLWGKKHGYAWAWAHCNDFDGDPDARLELIAGRIHRRGITTPNLLALALDVGGEQYRFNQLRHFVTNRIAFETGQIQLTARSGTARLVGELRCAPESLVLARYLDPDGSEAFCANTEIGDATFRLYRRAGLRWREHCTLIATRRAHFETGGRVRDPAVAREHILVR
jgi:hypothetical protein